MRNSKCTAVAERPGDSSGRVAQLIFGQTGHRTATECMFDYFSGIKNSALSLGIVVPEIKQIKQIKRRGTHSMSPDQSPDARCGAPDRKSNGRLILFKRDPGKARS